MSRATSIPAARLTRPYELNFWVPQRIQHPKRPATMRLWSWRQSGAPSLIAFIGRIFPVCVTSTIALSPCRPRARLLLRRMRSRRHRTVILPPSRRWNRWRPRTGFASIPNQKRRPDCFGLHNVRARIGSPSTRQSRSPPGDALGTTAAWRFLALYRRSDRTARKTPVTGHPCG